MLLFVTGKSLVPGDGKAYPVVSGHMRAWVDHSWRVQGSAHSFGVLQSEIIRVVISFASRERKFLSSCEPAKAVVGESMSMRVARGYVVVGISYHIEGGDTTQPHRPYGGFILHD